MKKFWWLAAIVILIGFAFYFHAAKEHVFRSLLKEKVVAISNDVNYVCSMVDYLVEQDGDWDVVKYQDSLAFLTEQIDSTPNVYAELFNSELETISNRVIPEGDSWWFEPRVFPELMILFESENTGYHFVTCPDQMCPNTNKPMEVHLHWQWIPTDSEQYENRVLLVVGVTQHSVDTAIDSWLIYGIVALFFTSTVIIVVSLIVPRTKKFNN